MLELAVARSIKAPDWYHLHIVLDHYRQRDYRAALAEIDRLANAEDIWALVLSAAIHAQLDSREEARRALERAEALNPRLLQDPRGAMRTHHFPEDVINQLVDGLRKAGLEVPAA